MTSKLFSALGAASIVALLLACETLVAIPDRSYVPEDASPPDASPSDGTAGVTDPNLIDASGCVRKDYDCDGHYDMLVTNDEDRTLSAWILEGGKHVRTLPIVELDGAAAKLPPSYKVKTTLSAGPNATNDLVLHAPDDSGRVIVWHLRGNTHVGTDALTEGGAEVSVLGTKLVGAGDFNGDGREDLVWLPNSYIEVWFMDGLRKGAARKVTEKSTGWEHQLTGEWILAAVLRSDPDANADLLVVHNKGGAEPQYEYTSHIWHMSGTARIGYAYSVDEGSTEKLKIEPKWELADTGDVDGDGHVDWLWRDATTGVVTVWLMNDTTRLGVRTITKADGNVPDPVYPEKAIRQ